MTESHEWEGGKGDDRAEALRALLARIDKAAPDDGGALILFELGHEPSEDPVALAEELCRGWELTGRTLLIVDGHPARPFLADHFGPEEEGFSEILHYGLSPGAVTRKRDDAPGLWIPAGALGDLDLEDPAEPARGLRRLKARADRVLLLASTRNDEGWLAAFRKAADFRIRLGEPEIDRLILARDARRHRVRVPMLITMGLIAVALLIGMFWPEGGGTLRRIVLPDEVESSHPAVNVDSTADSLLQLRTIPAEAPMKETVPVEESVVEEEASAPEPESVPEPAPETTTETTSPEPVSVEAEDAESPAVGEPEEGDRVEAPKQQSPPEEEPSKAAPDKLLRRFEGGSNWQRILDHSGSFHVHVGSYRDSVRAARSVALEGFFGYPAHFQPVQVKGGTWYRVCIGEFPDLAAAVAFRDSLLDQVGKDFCVVGINPEP